MIKNLIRRLDTQSLLLFLFQCRYWDDVALTWKNDSCTAERNLKTIGNKSFIVCHCTRTGTIAAFENPTFAALSGGPTTTRPSTRVVGSKAFFVILLDLHQL